MRSPLTFLVHISPEKSTASLKIFPRRSSSSSRTWGGANRGLRSLISTRIHRDTRAERSGYPKGKLCVTFGINVYLKTRWFARNLKSRQCGSISLQAFVVPYRGRWRRLDAGRGVPRFLTDWRLLANVQEPEQSPTVLSKLFTSRTTNDSLSRVRVGRGRHG